MRSIWCAAIVALAVTGCSTARAKTSPQSPPLDVPAPPPRDVEPSDAETPPPVPLPQEPARSAPARPRQTPPREQPRPAEPRVEPAKPEAPPAEPPKAEEPPKPPPSTLQTMPTNAEGEAERAIRATLQRANGDLNRVDYRGLNSDARSQYDTAKRMMRQADDAVRAKNLVFAKNLADKAAALAAQLAGR
jgi:hypothetical protein